MMVPAATTPTTTPSGPTTPTTPMNHYAGLALVLASGIAAPFVFYPVFLMKALCFALFACAFNLLLGYTGLLSFGHTAFFATAGYLAGYLIKLHGFSPLLGIFLGMMA